MPGMLVLGTPLPALDASTELMNINDTHIWVMDLGREKKGAESIANCEAQPVPNLTSVQETNPVSVHRMVLGGGWIIKAGVSWGLWALLGSWGPASLSGGNKSA